MRASLAAGSEAYSRTLPRLMLKIMSAAASSFQKVKARKETPRESRFRAGKGGLVGGLS